MMTVKKELINKIIIKKGSLRIDEFISLVLYEKNSYYKSSLPIGYKGDFITSPEISQMFGEIIGVYILNYWIENIKTKFNLIELGPGKGTLLQDIFKVAKLNNKFFKCINLKLIEKNENLIKIQKKLFNSINIHQPQWLSDFKIKSKLPSVIYSNEFFDCLPVRLFYKTSMWNEKFVCYNACNDSFYLKDKKVTEKKIIDHLKIYDKNKLAEISFNRLKYFKKLCNHIKKNKGLIILIDYGYVSPIKNFTLQSIFMHKKTNIFDNLGQQDISSLVNFKELIDITKKYDLKLISYCTQEDFLISNGIIHRKNILKKSLSSKKKEIIENQFKRLTDKNDMGSRFKFLIVTSK